MTDESLFHRGEQAVQKRLGVFEKIGAWAGQVVRPCLPAQHRDFYARLPFLVAAARDAQGRPWATVLAGAPGFVHSPDASRLTIDARPVSGDGLEGRLLDGAQVGLLGIELATRRRNRVNGVVSASGRGAIELSVVQSFGNCPQYIHEREWEATPEPSRDPRPRRSRRLDEPLRERIEAADTFFIATGHAGDPEAASHGMDASHRGGEPGFVRVLNDRRLVFPDYAGNNHFNTIGNLMVDPRAGLLFVDFETGGLLQLTGRATIDWDSPDVVRAPGAQRLVHFDVEQVIDLPGALPIRWRASRVGPRPVRVREKIEESADVTSFLLEIGNEASLSHFDAGQHLPIELDVPGLAGPVRRTYSLSNGPGERVLRISVKRESHGVASRFLHDEIEPGDVLRVRAPAGDFVVEDSERPIVCLSAGVGVTPMMSMLHAHVTRASKRPIHLMHVARDGAHHAFRDEMRRLFEEVIDGSLHVFYSQPDPADRPGRDFDFEGRIDAERVRDLLPSLDADFYLCGPVGFMSEMSAGLDAVGVARARIYRESFGPSTIA